MMSEIKKFNQPRNTESAWYKYEDINQLYYYKTLVIKTKGSIAEQLLMLNNGIKTQMKPTILVLTESGS